MGRVRGKFHQHEKGVLIGWEQFHPPSVLGALVWGLMESASLCGPCPSCDCDRAVAVRILRSIVFSRKTGRHPMGPIELFVGRHFHIVTGTTSHAPALQRARLAPFLRPIKSYPVQHTPLRLPGQLLPFSIIPLSRVAGGHRANYGANPLITGPGIAAIGFASFLLPGVGGSYWNNSVFPTHDRSLCLGMPSAVQPLDYHVMTLRVRKLRPALLRINTPSPDSWFQLAIAVTRNLMVVGIQPSLSIMKLSARLPQSDNHRPHRAKCRGRSTAKHSTSRRANCATRSIILCGKVAVAVMFRRRALTQVGAICACG